MNKANLVDALRALPSKDTSRPETARLREIFDDVEAAIGAGVRRAVLLATLHEQGFTMKAKTFESALYRIRRERIAAGERKPSPFEVQADAAVPPSPAAAQATQAPANPEGDTAVALSPSAPMPSGRKITTTADTVRLRRPQIDLENI